MESFIKKIFLNRADEQVHKQFVRFGKGIYKNRALLRLQKNSKIKLRASFEFASEFALFVSELGASFSGIVLSKQELALPGKKKAGLYEYDFSGSSEQVKKLENAYCLLLDAEGSGLSLKCKKKLPKPGKSGEGKIDDKFCQIEADLKYWQKIKEAFFWDVSDCKKASASHDYIITSIEVPKEEKNPEIMRVKARRKGKIIRKLEIDGKEQVEEKNIEV